MSLHIFIPCKSLPESKSRLAVVLTERERIALSLSLLERTLQLAVMLVPASQCHLISNDPDAARLAAKYGIGVISGAAPGLNRGLFHARSQLRKAQDDFELLVLPIDLPFADKASLEQLIHSKTAMAIAPDRDQSGTNVLYMDATASKDFVFSFGEMSFDKHCEQARLRGHNLTIVADPNLAFDLDTADHFSEMQARERDGGDALMGEYQ